MFLTMKDHLLNLYCFDRHVPISPCISPLPVDSASNVFSWPMPWPERLKSKPISLSNEKDDVQKFYNDTEAWSTLVSDVYLQSLPIKWPSVRNVMDMNAGYGG